MVAFIAKLVVFALPLPVMSWLMAELLTHLRRPLPAVALVAVYGLLMVYRAARAVERFEGAAGRVPRFNESLGLVRRFVAGDFASTLVGLAAYAALPLVLCGPHAPRPLPDFPRGGWDLKALWLGIRADCDTGLRALRAAHAQNVRGWSADEVRRFHGGLALGACVLAELLRLAGSRAAGESSDQVHRRGPLPPRTGAEAEAAASAACAAGEPRVVLGGVPIAESDCERGTLFLGAPGSGKTLSITLMAQGALHDVGRGTGGRALWFDAKQDSLSLLAGMGVPFKTMNVFDLRGAAWDMAKDITSRGLAKAVAEILLPPNPEARDAFFDHAARALMKEIMVAYIRLKPGRWTLKEVVDALRNIKRLRRVLGQTHRGRRVAQLYLSERRTGRNIMATVANATDDLEVIADAWAVSPEQISLRGWVEDQEGYVLVLGNTHTAKPVLRALNQCLFQRASQLLLDQPEGPRGRTWVFLDELHQFAKQYGKQVLESIMDLAVEGRSKHVCVVCATQLTEIIEEVFGEKGGKGLLNLFEHVAVLGLRSSESSEWARKKFGEREVWQLSTSTSEGSSQWTATRSWSIQKVDNVLPGEFMVLPPAGPRTGVHGFYLSPLVGSWRSVLHWDYLMDTLARPDPDVPNFIERPLE